MIELPSCREKKPCIQVGFRTRSGPYAGSNSRPFLISASSLSKHSE